MGSKRFSALAVLLSVVGAVIAFALGEVIIAVGGNWPSFVRIGLYFGVGAMAITALILISQKISPQLIGYRWKEMYYKNALKLYIPVTLLMVGLTAGLFQFIYSLDIHEENVIKNIVIVVDNSSSMIDTDPQRERFHAISSLIDNLQGDKSVALVTFDDSPETVIDFTSVKTKEQKEALKAQIAALNIQEEGQTGVRQAVDQAYNMLNATGNKGSLILVSDGAPTDGSESDIEGLVNSFVQAEMPVYTIGMMYSNPDTIGYLQKIADLTGGTCYNTSDTTMLKEVFGKISYNEDKGTMISPRSGAYITSNIYRVLRVAFILFLSILIAIALGIMFDNKYLVKGMVIGSLIGGLAGSMAMEIEMARGTLPFFARLSYWFILGAGLMTFTWCIHFKDSYHGTREA